MSGLNTQRHNTATRIRHNCASILGVSENDLLTSEVRKDKFREEIGWVSEARVYSSVDVPILHKEWRGEYTLSSVFLNPKLMGVSFHSSSVTPSAKLINFLDLRCPHSWAESRKALYEWRDLPSPDRNHGTYS